MVTLIKSGFLRKNSKGLKMSKQTKVLIWGENRDRIWMTLNSCKDVFPEAQIYIGSGDINQQNIRMVEILCSYSKVEFMPNCDGKLDFIGRFKDDPFVFCNEGVLVNRSVKQYEGDVGEGKIVFANIKLDDGRFLNECSQISGAFQQATDHYVTGLGLGQTFIFFISGGGINYPEYFKGNNGEGVTLSQLNDSEIKDFYVRYSGDVDIKVSQQGYYILVRGIKEIDGIHAGTEDQVKAMVSEEIYNLVIKKIDHETNRT